MSGRRKWAGCEFYYLPHVQGGRADGPHGDGVTAAYPERGEAFVRQGDIQARLCVFIQHDEAEAVARGDLAHTGRMPQNADGVKIHANAAP